MEGEDDCGDVNRERHLSLPTEAVVVCPATATSPCLFSGDSGDTRDFLLWLNHVQVYLKRLPSVEERILSLYQATAGEAREVMEAFLFEPKTKTTLDSAF